MIYSLRGESHLGISQSQKYLAVELNQSGGLRGENPGPSRQPRVLFGQITIYVLALGRRECEAVML